MTPKPVKPVKPVKRADFGKSIDTFFAKQVPRAAVRGWLKTCAQLVRAT